MLSHSVKIYCKIDGKGAPPFRLCILPRVKLMARYITHVPQPTMSAIGGISPAFKIAAERSAHPAALPGPSAPKLAKHAGGSALRSRGPSRTLRGRGAAGIINKKIRGGFGTKLLLKNNNK